MSRIAIIVGHARKDTYCEALGGAYRRGAEAGGHKATLFVTSKMMFDPILHEGFTTIQPLEHDLQVAYDAIMEADHLVFIFPLWLGTLPAIFKGFLERVLQPDLVEPSKKRQVHKNSEGKIGPRHNDHGHARVRLSLVFRCLRTSHAETEHTWICWSLTDTRNDSWNDRSGHPGEAAIMAC